MTAEVPAVPPESALPAPAGGRVGSPGAHQRRVFARVLDLGIALGLAWLFPPIGAGLALTYMLVADAIWQGQSLGKRLFGVTVLRIPSGKPGGLLTSIVRNLPMATVLLLAVLPLVSFILLPTLGLGLLAAESYLTRVRGRGRRMGDVLADCYVADWVPSPPSPVLP